MSDANGIVFSDLLGLSQPLTKLVETVGRGIGSCCKPWHIERMAKAKAKEIEIISKALGDNVSLPSNYNNGSVSISTQDANELIARAQNRFLFQEIKKQENIESVVSGAYEELKDTDSVSDAPVDETWILRFFNSVQEVSSSDMQKLWAKILAGEIQQPSTYSLRTLTILHDLSQQDAELFRKICNYVIFEDGKGFLPAYEKLLESAKILDIDLIRLNEYGLLVAPTQLYLGMVLGEKKAAIAHNDRYIVVGKCSKRSEYNLQIPHYALTKVGEEIYSLLQTNMPDSYFLDFAREIKKNNAKIDIAVYPILEISKESITYEDSTNLLT